MDKNDQNGASVGSGKIAKTEPNIYSADETASVDADMETPVSDDYTLATSRFTDSISKVTIGTKPKTQRGNSGSEYIWQLSRMCHQG